jgi:hypothetical protein
MANHIPNKPKATHPWRNEASPAAIKWAREQSQIRKVTNVSVARNQTLHRPDSKFEKQKGVL